MGSLVVFVKLNLSVPALRYPIGYIEESLNTGESRFYYTNAVDADLIHEFLASPEGGSLLNGRIVFILFDSTNRFYVDKFYIGTITDITEREQSYSLYYNIQSRITSRLVIDNLMRFSGLSVERDFEENSYISIERSVPLFQQISYAVERPHNFPRQEITYLRREEEANLSPLAQRNEYCDRMYNALAPSETQGEFQCDYDRIVQCRSFRRMVDKAQIFTSSKGDHYRTRMTHTLCVAQIARNIAFQLGMNVPLTEAIALGHDLGHTPFGHQGERTLNEKVKANDILGFKHNFQSLNVVSVLEEEYAEHFGMDLSFQVLEGVWKHTKIRNSEQELFCELRNFVPSDLSEASLVKLHPDSDFCSTMEGQIVFIADEIAQRSHDLDDALSAGLLTVEGLLETLSLKKLLTLKNKIEDLRRDMQEDQQNQRIFISPKELVVSRISALVISYFVEDVVRNVKEFLDNPAGGASDVCQYFDAHHCVDRQIVSFSLEGQQLNNYLDSIVKKQVINSAEVAAFDDKARRVVSSLFDLYYENPRLLHDGTLQRIYIKMRQITDNVIHFQEGDISLVNEEWERIKHPNTSPRLIDLNNHFPDTDFSRYANVQAFLDSLEDAEDQEYVRNYIAECVAEYEQKKKILLLSICDFISGMTDTYALDEYRRLIY